MKYSQTIIYYFSGTGNSENVARWFSETSEKNNIPCILINIANIDRLKIESPPKNSLLVFISPIHGFNYPPIMLHFIRRFPKGDNKIVLMNTRAGMLIGKFITPGLTGMAFYLSALILKTKGYSLVGIKPINMPSNWISLHPGLNNRTVKYLHEVNKKRVTEFTGKILSGKKDLKYLSEIIIDLLITPIGLGYYFFGRFFLTKTYFASSDCDNCDVCVKNCPVKAIIKIDNRPYWTFNCENCMRCIGNCPKKAIEVGHGFIAGIVILFYSVIILYFYKLLDLFSIQIENEILNMIIETIVALITIFLGYKVFHFLLKFRLFERFFVYTSLTKYKFWGRRYKALKNF